MENLYEGMSFEDITKEVNPELLEQEAAVVNTDEAIDTATQEQEVDTSAQPTQPPEQQQEGEQQQEEPKQEAEGPLQAIAQSTAELGKGITNVPQMALGANVGIADFGINLLNSVIPGDDFDIPAIPALENKYAEGSRKIAEGIGGELLIYAALKRVGLSSIALTRLNAGANKAKAFFGSTTKLGKLISKNQGRAKAMKTGLTHLGDLGAQMGASVAVNELTYEEGQQTVTGMTKQWLESMGQQQLADIMPAGIATGKEDSSDANRDKNRYEALFMPLVLPAAASLAVLVRGSRGLRTASQHIAREERAVEFAKELNENSNKLTGNVPKDVAKAASQMKKDLDDVGTFNKATMPEGTPMKGVHDVYDAAELGMRSADVDGAVGAMNDVYKIAKDVETYNGRVGSVFTEAAIKAGNLSPEADTLLRSLIPVIKKARGIDTLLSGGHKISAEARQKAVDTLYERMMNLDVSIKDIAALRKIMFKAGPEGKKILYEAQYNAAMDTMEMFFNPDKMRASAVLKTSMAGQISDLSEAAAENMNKMHYDNLKEMILERAKVLDYYHGVDAYEAGSILANQGLVQRIRAGKLSGIEADQARLAKEIGTEDYKAKIARRTERRIEQLGRAIERDPKFGAALLTMFKHTNGRVDSIIGMLNEFEQSYGSLHKAIYDNQPEIPQATLSKMSSNVYNSILSGFETLGQVTVGNIGGIVDHMVTPAVSYALARDWDGLARHRAGVAAMLEVQGRHFKRAREQLSNAVYRPDEMEQALRGDIVIENNKTLEAFELFAEYEAGKGNLGPQALATQYKMMKALSDDPLMRFLPNSMLSADAQVESMMATYTAAARAYTDVFQKNGKNLLAKDQAKAFKFATKRNYVNMFDENGVLKDSWTQSLTKNIALNENNAFSEGLGTVMRRVPVIGTMLRFPRTLTNSAIRIGEYSGMSRLPFIRRMSAFHVDDALLDDQAIETILKREGFDVPPERARDSYKFIKNRLDGRAMVGAAVATPLIGMALVGRVRGPEHPNYEIARSRRAMGWQPMTIQGLDGKWHDISWLGPIANVITAPAFYMDQMETMDDNFFKEVFSATALTLASMFDDANLLNGLKPVMDIADGKVDRAFARYSAAQVNSLAPLSKMRAEWSRLLDPSLRVFEREFGGYLRNRNGWLDTFMPGSALERQVSTVGGREIGHMTSPLQKFINAYTPFKSYDGQHPNEIFLTNWHYNTEKQLNSKLPNGVELTETQKNFISQHMGKNKWFQQQLTDIRKDSERPGIYEGYLEARKLNFKDVKLNKKDWADIYLRLDEAWQAAKNAALDALYDKEPELLERIGVAGQVKDAARTQDIETLLRLAN